MDRDPRWRRALRVPRALRSHVDRDIDEEIAFHLASRTDELVAGGVDPEAARRQAEREFGDRARARDALSTPGRRRERRRRLGAFVGALRRDVRESARALGRAPAFSLVVGLTLALAIGANAGIFSVANAVLFRPLSFPEPDRLVSVMEMEEGVHPRNAISTATFLDWRNEARSFAELGAYGFAASLALSDPEGPPRQIRSVMIEPAALAVLGAAPVLGRTFAPEEGVPGSPRVALLSWTFWQARFGGDERAIGRTVPLDGTPYEIVGVMGPRFAFPDETVEVWRNLRLAATSDGQSRTTHQWSAVGRLADGATWEAADGELDAISARLEPLYPREMTNWRARVEPLRDRLTVGVRPLMWVLLGVVGVVLLVACANLANLMLARFTARARELAVRRALGAGRARLVRRMAVEAGLLAGAGGAVGIGLAVVLMRLFVAIAPSDLPLVRDTRLDLAVLVFAVVATVFSALLFGLLPGIRSSRVDPAMMLRSGGRGSTASRGQSRWRAGLLVSQVALSSLLLVGAGLLIRSMIELQRIEYGYEPEGLVAVSINLPSSAYGSTEEQWAFYAPLIERIAGIPGVISVSGTSEPPVVGFDMSFGYLIREQPREGPDPYQDAAGLRTVGPGYFEMMGQRVLRGRPLEESDGRSAPQVGVVNESMAELHWAGSDPIGSRIAFQEEGPWFEIVGVVEDVWQGGADPDYPAFYRPFEQKEFDWITWQTLFVRTETEPAAIRGPIEEAIWSLDRNIPLERFEPVPDLYADSRARSRFAMQLMIGFAAVAMLLGAIGLYGVLAYWVGQRRQEIGVRMALGARAGTIASLVLGTGLRLCCVGLVIGLGAALVVTRYLESLLFGVGVRDPLTFAAIAATLLIVATLASWLPARRAASTEPSSVLRIG